jgi:mevalonate kinase
MVLCSAPAKLIIIGEHSVVYGKEAIATAINKRCYVLSKFSKKILVKDIIRKDFLRFCPKECLLSFQEAKEIWQRCFQKNDFSQLCSLLKNKIFRWKVMLGAILKSLNLNSGFSLEIFSQIPLSFGLGSSAALSLSLTKAIAELYELKKSKKRINEISFEIEKFYHGTPSGVDNTVSCFGGSILFKKGEERNQILFLKKDLFSFLSNSFLILAEKPKKSTGELVQIVKNLNKKYREKKIEKLGRLTKEMLKALKLQNFNEIRDIINEAQRILAELKVSTKKVDYICEKVKKLGGGAKLCGAGGGGVVMALHEDKEKLFYLLKKLKLNFFELKFAQEGLKKENVQKWKKLNGQLQEN